MSLDEVVASGNFETAVWLRPLAPALPQAQCWWCDLVQAARVVDSLRVLLSPAEHTRAARFGNETLRRRWIAGRATLRIVLGRELGELPAAVRLVRGTRGRPALADVEHLDFNVSHTGDAGLIVVAAGMRIGVDVERSDRSVAADRLAAKFLTQAERNAMTHLSPDERRIRFLRHWTCKVAMSKATGDGLAAPFRRIGVAVDLDGRLRVDAGPAPYAGADWALYPVAVPAPYLGTLAQWRTWPGKAA